MKNFDEKSREALAEYNKTLSDLCLLEREVLMSEDGELHRIALIGFFDFLVHLSRAGKLDLVTLCTDGLDKAIRYNRIGRTQKEIKKKKHAKTTNENGRR